MALVRRGAPVPHNTLVVPAMEVGVVSKVVRQGTPMVERLQVTHVQFQRGDGRETVLRNVDAYYLPDGSLLVEIDPFPGDEDLVNPRGQR